MVFPRLNPVDVRGMTIPGIGRFPVDEWATRGKPVMDQAGWYVLSQKIAEKDLGNLGNIYTLARRMAPKPYQ